MTHAITTADAVECIACTVICEHEEQILARTDAREITAAQMLALCFAPA